MVKSAEDKKAEKDAIEAELARQSTEAVRSLLSEDNLEALLELIQQNPDTWPEIFDNFGIAPSIRQALLDLVSSQT